MNKNDHLVVCSSCGQALEILDAYTTQGPVLPSDKVAFVVDPHDDCPRTLR